jgi:hypothetical protein
MPKFGPAIGRKQAKLTFLRTHGLRMRNHLRPHHCSHLYTHAAPRTSAWSLQPCKTGRLRRRANSPVARAARLFFKVLGPLAPHPQRLAR